MKLSSKRGIQKHEIEPSSSKGFDTDLSVKKLKKGEKHHTSSHSSAICREDMGIISTGGSGNVHPASDLTPREQQYLFSAGLHPLQVKKKRKQSDVSSSAATTTTTSAEEFATRALGSSCPRTRHDAIQRLQLYLSTCAATKGISYLDIKKLWKGMWYGLYMCDKVVVQDELSSHMAQLIWSVAGTIEGDMEEAQHYVNLEELALDEDKDDEDDTDDDDVPMDEDGWDRQPGELHQATSDEDEVLTSSSNKEECEAKDGNEEDFDNDKHLHHTSVHLVCLFLKGYFETIHREWGKMDKHRIDKFYRSMRLMLSEVFQYCATREWHMGIIHMLNDVVFNEILCCDEETIMLKYPNGVRFHLIDILLDEVVKVSNGITGDNNHHKNDSHVPISTIEFLAVLEPYLTIAMADNDKIVQARVVENILQKFLSQYSVLSDAQNDDENTTPLLLHHVNVQSVAEQIFDVASNVDTADRYRSSLYQMHKLYVRRIKEAKVISGCTTHCKENCDKETTTCAVPSNDMDHDDEEEISVKEEETKEESTSEVQGHKKQHKKKQKKRKSSASDVCENQSTQTNHTASNGKKTKVQAGNGDKGTFAKSAVINTSPAAENMLQDVTSTTVGIDSDTKRSKKRKNNATGKDNSERNDYAELHKNQSLENIQLTTANVNNSQQKRVESEIRDIVNSKKSKRQSMDDKKHRKDDKNVKMVGMHGEGVLPSKNMGIDNKIRKNDGMNAESVGEKQAGAVDPLPVKDKPYLITKKKRTKDDANLEKVEVKQGKTVNVVPSRTNMDKTNRAKEITAKFVEERPDATALKNDKQGLNKVGEKQKERVVNVIKSKNKTQSMDHKKTKKADIANVNSVDSASLQEKSQLMDDKKKPVDKHTGFADAASDSAATTKKNKEKQNQLSNLDFIAASKELDDEIVISLREQSDYLLNAVHSINSTQKRQKNKMSTMSVPPLTKKQQSAIDDAVEKERQRRVKFGCMNRSKSYKASMTALQTMQHPTTATREPEKPILREPKYASSPIPTKDKPKNRYVSAAQGQPKR